MRVIVIVIMVDYLLVQTIRNTNFIKLVNLAPKEALRGVGGQMCCPDPQVPEKSRY